MSKLGDLLRSLNVFSRIKKLEDERDELRDNVECVVGIVVALSDYIGREAESTAKLNESIEQIIISVPRRLVTSDLDLKADLDVSYNG